MDLFSEQIGPALLALGTLLLAGAVAMARRKPGGSAEGVPEPRREAARRLAVGGLVGSAIACCAAGIGVALGASDLGSTWILEPGPDSIAIFCVVALLFARGEAEGRSWWILGAVFAAAVAGTSAWLLFGWFPSASVMTPPRLGLVAAVVTGVLLSPGRRARRMARAHDEAIRASGDGILVVDAQWRVLDVRGAPAESVMESFEQGPDGLPRVPSIISDRLSREGAGSVRVKAGAVHRLEIWSNDAPSPGSRNALRGLLVRDISRQQRDERNLIRLAHYDSLTGLPNRRLFLRRLKRELEAARLSGDPCALLYLDIDHFKDVNDTLGHGVGDALLQEMARRLLEGLRPGHFEGSTLPQGARIHLARLSGDEFAAIISKVADSEAAREVADRAQKLFDEPFQVADRALTTSASIGIAIFPKDGGDVESLIRSADAAVYAAKNGGRRRSAFYEPSVNAEHERVSRVAHALGQAIRGSELMLHYQPKVDVASETTVGFEALLRWHSAELGTVSPGDFIPIAEERGLIQEIGAWCLDEACRQIQRWRADGFVPVPVSVNVSSIQFRDNDLQRTVTEALKAHGVEPELLEIELTESLLLEEGNSTGICLRDLRAIGVGIALDDFGTGYSALAYLNLFPLDVLKLDRAFIREIHYDRSAAKIVSAVVSMAHGLGMTVVAEGVHNAEQVPVLREMGCDQIQGFLYSPAVASEAAQRMLARIGDAPPVIRFAANTPGRLPGGALTATLVERAALEAEADTEQPAARCLLLVDDEFGVLRSVTERILGLGGMGIDLHYASLPDEARLLIGQEGVNAQALVIPPTLDLHVAVAIREQLAKKLGSRIPLVVTGEEPDPPTRARLRAQRNTFALWSPFEDVELAFVLKSALTPEIEMSRRFDIRVPVNLTARLQAGQRRESVVLSSLSPRGAFLEISDPPPVGTELRLEFDMPSDSFRLFARVLHHAQEDPECPFSQNGIGIAFFGVDRRVELMLIKEVEDRAARYVP